MVRKGAVVGRKWGEKTGDFISVGRKLGKFEIASRKALRRARVGKPLFRKGINKALADLSSIKAEQIENTAQYHQVWKDEVRSLLKSPDNSQRQLANSMGNAISTDYFSRARGLNEKKGEVIANLESESQSRKSGIKGGARMLLAGGTARRKLKRIKAINPNWPASKS